MSASETAAAAPVIAPPPATLVAIAPWRAGLSDFAANPFAVFGAALLVLVLGAALFAPWLAPTNPYDLTRLDLMDALQPPGSLNGDGIKMWLGADGQGRDMLSAVLYGLRTSIIVGVGSGVAALAIGFAVGLAAAYFGGWVDALAMRLVDLQLSVPSILVAMVMLAVLGQGVDKIIMALIVVQWAYYARTARGAALVERQKDYVAAALCLGVSQRRVIFVHMLRNCLPPVIVVGTMQVASAISLEATLSFLGLGLPVTEPSLGLLISNGFQYLMSGRWWISLFPGIALLVTIVAINLVGDQLRDVLNPRLQK
jgi:peptide/nickel transport system permease protein